MRRAAALALLATVLALASPRAVADWPHEVKWDQLDNPSEQVVFSTVNDDGQTIAADDFLCDETGWITDIEFWGGYSDIFALNALRVTFWEDVPATGLDESHPGQLLREIDLTEACPCDELRRGWQLLEGDRFKINLFEEDWFRQEAGTVYWIGIQGLMDGHALFYWHFRDPGATTSGDDATFAGDEHGLDSSFHIGWRTESEATTYTGTLPDDWFSSADLCFRLTGTAIPEPASICLVAAAAVLFGLGRRRRG